MKVVKAELLQALSAVKPGLAKKEIVEQATHFIFSGKDVSTFNDQVCVIHPFKSDFKFSIKSDDFYKVVGNISEAEFDISLNGDCLDIKSKKTTASLSTILGDAAKVEHLIENIYKDMSGVGFFKPLPKEFIDGVYLCLFSANKDISTGVRACIAINGELMYSTDNIRVSHYIMDSGVDEMMIPAKVALDLVKYNVIEYGISENWVHFRTKDNVFFNCKMMKGEYPYKMVSKVIADVEPEMTFPADLVEAVASVVALAEGEMDVNKSVLVTVSTGTISIKAEKERGWIEKKVDFEDYKGGTFRFTINPIFFAQILGHATGFNLLESRAQFSSDNFYHVLSLPAQE